ncbi:HK97 gp10 family phage protein [Blastopirellula marina]|uniref:HK97 gp10 family phage protein n=1 Tax=Blastopirellula marina TaxID=124 RepID=UPI0011AFEEC1|nr:HK97 gp10 family phage protein [Blastopirellula marina]
MAQKWAQEKQKEVEEATYRAMVKTGLVGEARVRGIIEREAHDTGAFLRSISTTIFRNPTYMTLVIASNLEYAFYLEYGRKPGKWPNLDAMTKWVGRKLREEGVNTRVNITFDQLKEMARSAKRGKPTAANKAARAHLAALYLIGRKIATKGVRQKLIFKRIEDGLLAYLNSELQKEFAKIA